LVLSKIILMPLTELHAPFDHADWLFEVKYDGFRALAYLERGTVRLVSRNGNGYNPSRRSAGRSVRA
jgi:bifunctional non-homologous end joining protein LigD